jgi:hypothetical protein
MGIFRSLNACVLKVKPRFVFKESLIQNEQIVANEIKKAQTILMAESFIAPTNA